MFDGSIIIVSHDRYFIRSVIEGQDDSESESEDEDDTTDLSRTSAIFALRNKRLERLEDGINGYEQVLVKDQTD